LATKIFISYRRDDSAGHAGRIHDRLEREFGRNMVFMDVDKIPLGENFLKVLREEVGKCSVLLAIIGPGWLDARDGDGLRRLDDPNDFVRAEIAAALDRDIPVIPILLDGMRIPRADQLPEDLQELPLRNGLDVRHASFHKDMATLIRELNRRFDVHDAPPAWLRPEGGMTRTEGPATDAMAPPPSQPDARIADAQRRSTDEIGPPPSWLRPDADMANPKARSRSARDGSNDRVEPERRVRVEKRPTKAEAAPQRTKQQRSVRPGPENPRDGRQPHQGSVASGGGGHAAAAATLELQFAQLLSERTKRGARALTLLSIADLGAVAAGLIAIGFGIWRREYEVLVVAGSIPLVGGLMGIGLTVAHPATWFALGVGQGIVGLLTLVGDTQGRAWALAGAIALVSGMIAVGFAANRGVVWWLLGIGGTTVGLITIASGASLYEFALGRLYILAGTIALFGGLFAIGRAANHKVVSWTVGAIEIMAGLSAIASGIPIHDFAFGVSLILAGTCALAAGLIEIGLVVDRNSVRWIMGVGEGAIGVIAIGLSIPIHEFSLGQTLTIAGSIAVTGGLGLLRLGHGIPPPAHQP
jgi:TIR domain